MSPSLVGLVKTQIRKEGNSPLEKVASLAKGVMNSDHSSPSDYKTAQGGDERFLGQSLCRWGDAICPYGSGRQYVAGKDIFLGPSGSGGLDIIWAGQPVVICSLGKTAAPDSPAERDLGYSGG